MLRFALWAVMLWPLQAAAQDEGLPLPLSAEVSDFADVIPEEAETAITEELLRHRDETGVQMVVVTMLTPQGGRAGERVEDYAKRLFNAWGVGDSTRNDGVMILLVVQDRVVRIATGAAYDRVYDGYAQRVIDTTMLPAFRQGRFADGLRDGVDSARIRIIDRFVAANGGVPEPDGAPVIAIVIGCLVTIGAPLGLGTWIWRRRRKCPDCGKQGLVRNRQVTRSATAVLAGEGLETTHCRFCDHHGTRSYSYSKSSGRRSGGFGGGRSGGGGATGRW